jgi:hypothetical protein
MYLMPEKLQQQIYQEIYNCPAITTTTKAHDLWYHLNSLGDCATFLGELGDELKYFAQEADLEHPNFPKVLADDVADTLIELLNVARLAWENKYSKALSCFPKVIKKMWDLRLPALMSQYVSVLKDPEKRLEIRAQKRGSDISLAAACKGESVWFGLPEDFCIYARNSKAYEQQVVNIKQRAEKYKNLGCATLFKEIQKSIDEFEDNFKQSYYGFHRLKMTDAAIILAKMHGFELAMAGDNYEIVAKAELFDDIKDPAAKVCAYTPVAYPSHAIILPEPMQKMIAFLEAFPEAGGKPIFDHYIFVVPNIHPFLPQPEKRAMDGIFLPILMGEKDGKCFFICHWE